MRDARGARGGGWIFSRRPRFLQGTKAEPWYDADGETGHDEMIKPTPQQKADMVRATVERVLEKSLAMPMTAEKVGQLQIAKSLVEQLKACNIKAAGADFGETDSLDRKVADIERACRDFGLFEAYADLSVDRRSAIRECLERAGL